MSESPDTPDKVENPHDDDLDVEGPNESTPNQNADPRKQDGDDAEDA
jgi:hypothetical protein